MQCKRPVAYGLPRHFHRVQGYLVHLQETGQEAGVAERARAPERVREPGARARAQVWLVEDGRVTEYPGYFEDYKNELVKEIAAEMEDDEPAGPTQP